MPQITYSTKVVSRMVAASACDGGGSNCSSSRLFKQELIKLSEDLHIDIIVTHYPPYTSKWNPIEHRLLLSNHQSMERYFLRALSRHPNLPQRPERNPAFVFSPASTERSTTLLVVWIAIMMMSVNGILPLIKISLNGTTRFHGEIKNTKLIFKRY